MFKQGTLSSIPEFDAEDGATAKWVPKKKHEVLKAKYKCLKKLFQIYDASVIGILPEQTPDDAEEVKTNRRRKRSHRTKTDACAGTNEVSSGDNTEFDNDSSSVATAIMRGLNIDHSISTQFDAKIDKFAETVTTEYSEKNFDTCNCQMLEKHCQKFDQLDCQFQEKIYKDRLLHAYPQLPYMGYERPKLTRFQCFVQRLFGIRKEAYKPEWQMHAASDPVLTCREKRRRRGLRFRRLRRPKKVKSEGALRDLKNPSILSYVQSVQKSCLMDTTPRKCPIIGCHMVFYGIINYNDHINLCHFRERKFICHYCHEGFEAECDKVIHEGEHIGINKMGANMSILATSGAHKIASNTQTEPAVNIQDEKLKKIVSFFDKIDKPDQVLTEIKKGRFSETNLTSKVDTGSVSASERSEETETVQSHTISCCNMRRKTESNLPSSQVSDASSRSFIIHAPFNCRYCGENFTCKRQLTLHVKLEHRARYTKYHSCAGIVRPRPRVDMLTEDGSINVQSAAQSLSYDGESLKRIDTSSSITQEVSRDVTSLSRGKSVESVLCDPNANIVYYTSEESLVAPQMKPSAMESLASRVRNYRWEPATTIIRV